MEEVHRPFKNMERWRPNEAHQVDVVSISPPPGASIRINATDPLKSRWRDPYPGRAKDLLLDLRLQALQLRLDEGNRQLSSLRQSQESTEQALGPVGLPQRRDLLGSSLHFGGECWISRGYRGATHSIGLQHGCSFETLLG